MWFLFSGHTVYFSLYKLSNCVTCVGGARADRDQYKCVCTFHVDSKVLAWCYCAGSEVTLMFKCTAPYVKHPLFGLKATLFNKTGFVLETYRQLSNQSEQTTSAEALSDSASTDDDPTSVRRLDLLQPVAHSISNVEETVNELMSSSVDLLACYYPFSCHCICSKTTHEGLACTSCTSIPDWHCSAADVATNNISHEGKRSCRDSSRYVSNALFDSLTIGTPFPCVLALLRKGNFPSVVKYCVSLSRCSCACAV